MTFGRLGFGLGFTQGGGTTSLAAQIAANGAFLALYDPADTSSIYRPNGYGSPVQGDSDSIRAIANVLGKGSAGLQAWVDAQPNEVGDGTLAATGTAGYSETLGADSFRLARNTGGIGACEWTPPSLGDWYYFEGDMSAYDGAISGITAIRTQASDNYQNSEGDLIGSTAGQFKLLMRVAAKIVFNVLSNDRGARIDNFKCVKLPDYSMWQPTTASQPIYNLGRYGDGTDDFLIMPEPSSGWPTKFDLTFIVKTTDASGTLLSPDGTATRLAFDASTALAIAGVLQDGADYGECYVDGVSIGSLDTLTRTDLTSAIADGAAHTVTITKLIGSAFTGLGAYLGMLGSATSAFYAISENFDLTSINTSGDAEALALAEQWAAQKITELGL